MYHPSDGLPAVPFPSNSICRQLLVLYVSLLVGACERATWERRRAGQDGEDGGVWMIKSGCIHRAEHGQVVLVGRVVPVPGNDIEGGVALPGTPEPAIQLVDHGEAATLPVFKPGCGCHEMPGRRQAISTCRERHPLGKPRSDSGTAALQQKVLPKRCLSKIAGSRRPIGTLWVTPSA